MKQLSQCQAITGNPDFYGLGIRLGVYLQLVSSYISNSLHPEAAADNHDANSIFLFAVLIAVLLATSKDSTSIYPVESWVMLQICLAFVVTVMGVFGLRMRCLRPDAVAATARRIRTVDWKTFNAYSHAQQNKTTPQSSLPVAHANLGRTTAKSLLIDGPFIWLKKGFTLKEYALTFSLQATSEVLKHRYLSWAGVAWRVSVATILYATNIWFWFWFSRFRGTTTEPCSWTLFFFGPLAVKSSVLVFFKVLAIAVALSTFWLACFMGTLFLALIRSAYVIMLRYFAVGVLGPDWWNSTTLKRRTRLAQWSARIFAATVDVVGQTLTAPLSSHLSILAMAFNEEFWLRGPGSLPSFTDIIKGYIVLSSQSEESQTVRKPEQAENGISPMDKLVSGCLHMWTFCAIAWFIVSIELTIKWNNITGVFDINTTGQLIPFIIGLMSFLRTLHQILLIILKKSFPDWSTIDFNIGFDDFATQRIELVKKKKERFPLHVPGLQDPSGRWH